MAKKRQVSLNVPEEVHKWIMDLEIDEHCSKSQIGSAGLLLLALETEDSRQKVLTLARYVDAGLLSWHEALTYGEAASRRTVRFMELSEIASRRHLDRERAAREVEEAARKQRGSKQRRPKGA